MRSSDYTDKKNKEIYGKHSRDPEHIKTSDSDKMIPPRILNPKDLTRFRMYLPQLKLFYDLMQGDKRMTCDILIGRYKLRTQRGDKGKDVPNRYGDLKFKIDISGMGKIKKKTRNIKEFPKIWNEHFHLLMIDVLKVYEEIVFPNYIHFILKDSPICPMPFPYFEMFVKADRANGINIFSDFKLGDSPNLILPDNSGLSV